jgi:hypothetical protein
MRKSDLLHAIQNEIRKHDLDTYLDPAVKVVTPGCPRCKKTLYTASQFIDHINNDILPTLIDRLAKAENASPPDADFLDVDYWASPDRKICRKSGEQEVILMATAVCSKSEWMMLLAGLGMGEENAGEYS